MFCFVLPDLRLSRDEKIAGALSAPVLTDTGATNNFLDWPLAERLKAMGLIRELEMYEKHRHFNGTGKGCADRTS
jgi:hypothetical protein